LYCNKCGKIIPEESIYCNHCGNKMNILPQHKEYNKYENESGNSLCGKIDNFEYEILRRRFKPEKIKVLFIAESPPPVERRTFFYLAKSGVYIYTKRAFCNVYREGINKDPDFLYFFKDKGCYLEDLSSLPSNLGEIKRNKKFHINCLTKRIKEHEPESIIIIGKGIGDMVKEAISLSGFFEKIGRNMVFDEVPFAGNGHQNDYIYDVEIALKKLISKNILES
jgi:hypothetical protein